MPRARMIAFVVCLAAGPALGAGSPSVESVVPAIGARGSEFVVTLTGGRLTGAAELVFYENGLDCSKLEVDSENEVRATLRAAADCRPGAHPFRVRTPGGLSEVRVVHVGPLPVVAEVEPNDTPEAAQALPMNATLAGVIDSGDVDVVKVTLAKGQRLSAEAQAIRLGGEMTDTLLTIRGPDGRELARVDDAPMTWQDPHASLLAPEAGTYTIAIRDTSFGGGPAHTYALHVGDFPRPSSVFPNGAQAGTRARLELRGAAGETDVMSLQIPHDAGPWWSFYPTIDGRLAPTPTALRVRPYPVVVESEPARPGDDEPRPWPVAFHGVLASRGAADRFAIRVRACESIRVEAFAERLGSPLDAILEVFDPAGNLVGRNDDDASHDSLLAFRAATDGAYRIAVTDKRRQGGPGFVYRLEVEAPRPGMALFVQGPQRKTQARQALEIPRGNRILAYLGVRRDGFDGPVQVDLSGLPSGVKADVPEIPAGAYLVPVVLEAAADAPLGVSLADVRGSSAVPTGTVRGVLEQPIDLVPGPGDTRYFSVEIGKLAVAVTEPTPYLVTLAPPKAALARDGALDIVATVERAPGFDGPIEVSLPHLPPGVEMEGPGVVPAGQDSVVLRVFARPDADTTDWRLAAEAHPAPPRRDRREMTLALQAQAAPAAGGGARRRVTAEGQPPVASPFVPLTLSAAPLSGRFAAATAGQGETVVVACGLDEGAPRPPMVATLEGLPPRAEAGPVEVAPDARSVEFRVTISPTTPLGEHDTLVCRMAGRVDGQPVVYRVGRVGRLKVTAPGSAATDADGRPLSPLDALRLKERAASSSGPPATP